MTIALWTQPIPAGALSCGRSTIRINAPTEALADVVARNPRGQYVNAQVSAVVAEALSTRPAIRALPTSAKLLYVLGRSTALPDATWEYPFEVFALP